MLLDKGGVIMLKALARLYKELYHVRERQILKTALKMTPADAEPRLVLENLRVLPKDAAWYNVYNKIRNYC